MASILIVDDERDLAELLKEILELEGNQVDVAWDGPSAISRIENKRFDLAFVDIRLPGMNGVEVFFKIKEKDPHCKTIMMTGFAMEHLIKQALINGAYGCLYKPYDPESLIEIVNKALLNKNNKKVLGVNNGRIKGNPINFYFLCLIKGFL